MTTERWRQIEEVFSQVLDHPPAERSRFLEEACQGDEELRREVESLLVCDTPEEPLVEIPASFQETDPDWIGRRIGTYRLVRLLGHGGMGSVYLGVRDDDQYRKEVAIKLLNRGMDTDFMLSRFRQERQILANLEHPFIARLIDGGATEEGLPYFVMEYVDGIPITKYCEEKNLSIVDRLRLFRLVCEAVQHAHQNLVVHRDLKPSNILTTKEGIPKLLDFGIAKVLDRGASSGETMTQPQFRMMTPDYASPEQAKGLAIGTASDTYSLGAVLYELLSGQKPHRFESESPSEWERTICEVEPDKPSTVAPLQSKRQLRGDLDNVVLAAMRKEPQRRYASAAEFSEDLRRHLEGLPILAHEDRWGYTAAKFLRRNKLSVGAALLVAASLIAGMITTTFQARRADRRFQLVRELANSVLYDLHDRVQALPGSTSARVAMIQTVVKYLDRLAEDSGGDPRLDLEIAQAYARVATAEGHPRFSSLGQTVAALGHYRKSIEIFERLVRRPETQADALRNLVETHIETASVEGVLGRPAAVAEHMQKAAEVAAGLGSGGGGVPRSTLVALYLRLGSLESDRGNWEAEQANTAKAVETSQAWVKAENSREALAFLRDSSTQLANAKAHAGDLYGARDAFRRAFAVAEQLTRPLDSVSTPLAVIGLHHVFGDMLGATDDPNLGETEEALSHFRAAATAGEALVASDSKDVNARRTLAGSYRRVGLILLIDRPAEALRSYRKAVELSGELAASEPQNIHYRSALADGLLGVGQALHKLGKEQEALETLRRTLELQKSIEAADPEQIWLLRSTSKAYLAIGTVLLKQGDSAGALSNYREGLAAAERSLRRFPSTLHFELDRADLLDALGAYHLNLAAHARPSAPARTGYKDEARSWYGASMKIWQGWKARNVAVPYAERRLSSAMAALASIDRI